jgi:hypothetical protein
LGDDAKESACPVHLDADDGLTSLLRRPEHVVAPAFRDDQHLVPVAWLVTPHYVRTMQQSNRAHHVHLHHHGPTGPGEARA